MACYVVTFEPVGTGATAAISEKLKAINYYCPINEYSWAVVTNMTAAQLRDYLMAAAPTSRIFVVRSGTEAAWVNSYGAKFNDWLKANL
jgi:hypothetical protein